jgi:NAD+ synthase
LTARRRRVRQPPPAGPAADAPDLRLDPALTSKILEGFLRNELHRSGKRRLVVGLSGGLDSAVAAFLAVRALGPESLIALVMPHRDSSPDSERDAEGVVGALGIVAERIDITPFVDGFLKVTEAPDRLRLGNVMARCRMTLLYDRSAVYDALVMGTSNKTELLLGYGTLHGDLASALNPIGDLYKTQVRQLGGWLGMPRSILKKPPSADLWPDQRDEDELGFSYDVADRLLALLVDARVSRAAAIEAGFPARLVDRVTRLVVRSQFKRRLPVIAKVSTRSVGWDFRYPRDWKS